MGKKKKWGGIGQVRVKTDILLLFSLSIFLENFNTPVFTFLVWNELSDLQKAEMEGKMFPFLSKLQFQTVYNLRREKKKKERVETSSSQ